MLNSNLKIFHQNIQDLKNRVEPLEIILTEVDPDIFIITEHSMSNEQIDRLNINNYKRVTHYARTTSKGGGVLIMAREGFKGRQLGSKAINELVEDKLFECCVAEFKIDKKTLLIAGVYRTPQLNNSEFLSRLNSLLSILTHKNYSVCVGGDFNINMLENSVLARELNSILTRHGLVYLIDFPTRVATKSETCLDNFFTNINRDETVVTGLITALSDHDGQLLEVLNVNTPMANKSVKYSGRTFSKENIAYFKNLLHKEDWRLVYYASVGDKYNVFHNLFRYYFDLSFPKTQKNAQ